MIDCSSAPASSGADCGAGNPSVSVVIRSKDESARLRLTLESLAWQTQPCEVVVIDDGSSDSTPAVLEEMAGHHGFQYRMVHHRNESAQGRSEASNQGAALASGDVVLFLDGDTLAGPDFVACHAAVQAERGACIARGETWHLRQTRPYLDPELGVPFPHEREHLRKVSDAERARSLITRTQIAKSFDTISPRGQPGIYPGAGPRVLFEIEMAALLNSPECPTLWAAASGANMSVPRKEFLASGGFDPELIINEHREFALRFVQTGMKMAPASGARSFHMIHRRGWRDPLHMPDWEAQFFARHAQCEVALLHVLWASVGGIELDRCGAINDLEALHEAGERCRAAGGDALPSPEAVRALHFSLAQSADAGQSLGDYCE